MEKHEINITGSEDLCERLELCIYRIAEIANQPASEVTDMAPQFAAYFYKTASFIMSAMTVRDLVEGGLYRSLSTEKKAELNRTYYGDIFPENYGNSYACPGYAAEKLGKDYGPIFSFLYTELRSLIAHIMRQDLYKCTVLLELFSEMHFMMCDIPATPRQLSEIIYSYAYDYADLWVNDRVRAQLDPSLDFERNIIMNSDLSDLSYLYDYGDYISENETGTAAYLARLDDTMIREMAGTFVNGYVKGFELKGSDLSKKQTVDLRYSLGFERVMREAILMFEEMGLQPVIYPAALNTLNKKKNIRIGYISTSPNEQYEYDHRFDEALYLNKHIVDRKLACMRTAYEEYEELAAGYAGPAVWEVFGEKPFEPAVDEHATALSEKQRALSLEYTGKASEIVCRFINQEERSFTIISYPVPAIGKDYEEIFREVHKVNTLDYEEYKGIQQHLIDALDDCEYARIIGRNGNRTDMTLALMPLDDPEHQTRFENCLADVNIPLGEVFTSPKLEGTHGTLYLKNVFLDGLNYLDLELTFADGKVTGYECGNFVDTLGYNEEQAAVAGRKYVFENLLENHDTLPIGEFAIGTNTVASRLADRFGIHEKMPILIAEKTGPHLALGDTCYSYEEEVRTFNPDGKEIVAKENSCSALRNVDRDKAYFQVHTDITIPYEELGCIKCVKADGSEVYLIKDGRFVLPGTEKLNEALDQ